MSRFIVLVLDGFGVGAMEDAGEYCKNDINANTCVHVLESNPTLSLPTLARLGLMNIIGMEMNGMRFSDTATYGKAKLKHYGADTFFGHQEIMGMDPVRTCLQSFASMSERIGQALEEEGYPVKEYPLKNGAKAMGIAGVAMVADNQMNDPGQVYNVVGVGDLASFDEILKISKIIRSQVQITRVIAHSCNDITYEDLENALIEHVPGYGGIDTVKLNIYEKNVQIRHLGYGVNEKVQTPYLLGKHGIEVTHLGKFADLVANPFGKNISCVNTGKLLEYLNESIRTQKTGLIAINIQETDLSGHEQNAGKYGDILKQVDRALEKILPILQDDDRLIIMADHGNDPTNGSSLHSREYVPLMIYGNHIRPGNIGVRETMSDVGATVLDYFKQDPGLQACGLLEEQVENGVSFLGALDSIA